MNKQIEELVKKCLHDIAECWKPEAVKGAGKWLDLECVLTKAIPIIRQELLGDMQEQLDKLNKDLDDREEDLINAKKEEREEIKRGLEDTYPLHIEFLDKRVRDWWCTFWQTR